VPSPSSSTSHDTTQSSNMSHRKNLSHHLSPKLTTRKHYGSQLRLGFLVGHQATGK
jgi:hypothetical protein